MWFFPAPRAALREVHRHGQQAHGRRRGAAEGPRVPRLGHRHARFGAAPRFRCGSERAVLVHLKSQKSQNLKIFKISNFEFSEF